MESTLREGQVVLVQKKWFFCVFKKGDVVFLKDPRNGRILLKRIIKIRYSRKNISFFVQGDNAKESTDSRDFGWVDKRYLSGKVLASKW